MTKKNPVDALKEQITENAEMAGRIRESVNDVIDVLPDSADEALTTLVAVMAMFAWANEKHHAGSGALLIHEFSMRTMLSLKSSIAWARDEEGTNELH